MKLYLVFNHLTQLRRQIAFDTPVYIDEKHYLAGFKQVDNYIVPRAKRRSRDDPDTDFRELLLQIKWVYKHRTLDCELVMPNKNYYRKAKFSYDKQKETLFFTEDLNSFSLGQFNRFCEYYTFNSVEQEEVRSFLKTKTIESLSKSTKKKLNFAIKINFDNTKDFSLWIALLTTKIYKF